MTKKIKKQIENKLQNSKQNKSRKIISNDEFNYETNSCLSVKEINNNNKFNLSFTKEIIEISSDEECSSNNSSSNSSSSSSSSNNSSSSSKLQFVKEKKLCGSRTGRGGFCRHPYNSCPFHKKKEIPDDINEISIDEESLTTNSTLCGKLTAIGDLCRNKTGHCCVHDRKYIICGAKNKYSKPCLQTQGKCPYHNTFEERIEYIKLNLKEEDKVNLNFIKDLKLNYEDIKNNKIKFSDFKGQTAKDKKAACISYCYFMSKGEVKNNQLGLYFNTSISTIGQIKSSKKKEMDQYLLYFYNTSKKNTNVEEFSNNSTIKCHTCDIFTNNFRIINIDNYIKIKNTFTNKVTIIGKKVCMNCFKKAKKIKIENTFTKQIINQHKYNNFDDYLNNLNNYFTNEKKESQFILQNIYEFIASKNEGVTMNDIYKKFDVKILESLLLDCQNIVKDINVENEIVYKYNDNNALYIPNIIEDQLKSFKELQIQFNSELFTFDYNNYTNFDILKSKIDSNIKNYIENKSNNNNNDVTFSRNMINTFLIENYKKLFHKEAPFIDKMTKKNKIIYTIVNNYKQDFQDTSIIRLWVSVNKIFDKNFEFPSNNFRDDIYNIIYSKNKYSLYFTQDLPTGYFNIKFYNNKDVQGKTKEKIKQKKRTQNYNIINNRAKLLTDYRIGSTKIRNYHCINELENNLNDKLNFYTDNNIYKSNHTIFDMDHIPYLNSQRTTQVEKKYRDGFCVSFCGFHINQLLKLFSMEDRLLLRILKENNFNIKNNNYYKINYRQLKDNISKEKLNEWISDIQQKINVISKKVRNQVLRRHTNDELQYLFNNVLITFKKTKGIQLVLWKDKSKEHENLVWDHSHENSWKLFNVFTKYLNLSVENVNSDDDMYRVFMDIRNKYIGNGKLLQYLMHSHIMYYGRGFIDDDFNKSLGNYETLLRLGWDDKKIWQEITSMLIGDPILDNDGYLIPYFA